MTAEMLDTVDGLSARLSRLFAAAMQSRMAPHGVLAGQMPVLMHLWEQDGLTQSELCEKVGVEQPTMANTVKRMERDGLVKKRRDNLDRRKFRVLLTARANELRPLLEASMQEVRNVAVEGLDSRQIGVVLDVMHHMERNLRLDAEPPLVLEDVVLEEAEAVAPATAATPGTDPEQAQPESPVSSAADIEETPEPSAPEAQTDQPPLAGSGDDLPERQEHGEDVGTPKPADFAAADGVYDQPQQAPSAVVQDQPVRQGDEAQQHAPSQPEHGLDAGQAEHDPDPAPEVATGPTEESPQLPAPDPDEERQPAVGDADHQADLGSDLARHDGPDSGGIDDGGADGGAPDEEGPDEEAPDDGSSDYGDSDDWDSDRERPSFESYFEEGHESPATDLSKSLSQHESLGTDALTETAGDEDSAAQSALIDAALTDSTPADSDLESGAPEENVLEESPVTGPDTAPESGPEDGPEDLTDVTADPAGNAALQGFELSAADPLPHEPEFPAADQARVPEPHVLHRDSAGHLPAADWQIPSAGTSSEPPEGARSQDYSGPPESPGEQGQMGPQAPSGIEAQPESEEGTMSGGGGARQEHQTPELVLDFDWEESAEQDGYGLQDAEPLQPQDSSPSDADSVRAATGRPPVGRDDLAATPAQPVLELELEDVEPVPGAFAGTEEQSLPPHERPYGGFADGELVLEGEKQSRAPAAWHQQNETDPNGGDQAAGRAHAGPSADTGAPAPPDIADSEPLLLLDEDWTQDVQSHPSRADAQEELPGHDPEHLTDRTPELAMHDGPAPEPDAEFTLKDDMQDTEPYTALDDRDEGLEDALVEQALLEQLGQEDGDPEEGVEPGELESSAMAGQMPDETFVFPETTDPDGEGHAETVPGVAAKGSGAAGPYGTDAVWESEPEELTLADLELDAPLPQGADEQARKQAAESEDASDEAKGSGAGGHAKNEEAKDEKAKDEDAKDDNADDEDVLLLSDSLRLEK